MAFALLNTAGSAPDLLQMWVGVVVMWWCQIWSRRRWMRSKSMYNESSPVVKAHLETWAHQDAVPLRKCRGALGFDLYDGVITPAGLLMV